MRIQILISVLLFTQLATAHPIDCYEAASQDRVIKFSDDLKTALCRKATSTAPYDCFAKVYTNSSDYRISSTLGVVLCQGATDIDKPLDCFNQALTKFRGQITNMQAIKFCSGTTSATEAIACFEKARSKYGLDNELAADLCAH